MGSFIEKIKEFFADIKRRIIFISAAAALVAGIIILIAVLSGKDNDDGKTDINREIEPTAEAVTPTLSPTPTPTATPLPTATPTPEITPEPSDIPEEILHEGEVVSVLDGTWVKEETAKTRPWCLMFNNIEFANPQSGTGDAKILYEILAEGGITRLMGVFEGMNEESTCSARLGSVRSARHYYASIADEYDAIFVHYGETTYATKKISELKLDHLEGTHGEGSTVFYRDNSIKAPHNAFTSFDGIKAGIKLMKLREEHKEDFDRKHFTFGETVLPEDSKAANYIHLDYSTYMKPYFTYDAETGKYTRYQFGGVHIDYNTKEPLTFDNIIIQLVKEWDKDKNGYQDIELADASGKGYYITGGKCIDITWKKNEKNKTCAYYDTEGNLLQINPGKTFISLFPTGRLSRLEISETIK